jgi:glycosyltransferase involved in cell wall biosynthesis
MKILFLSRWYPYPPDNGSKIRILNLLRALCESHNVTLISFINPEEDIPAQSFPSPGPAEIKVCPYREFRPYGSRALLGFFSRKPRWLIDTDSTEMRSLIRKTIDKIRFDLIIASQTSMACYYPYFSGIPAMFEEVELGCFYPDRSGNTLLPVNLRRRLTWAKHKRYIAGLLPHFKLCTVTSEVERRMLAEAAPGFQSVYVIPNSIDLARYPQTPSERMPGSMIFTGSLLYSANYDAMIWFLSDIYPKIRAEIPEVQLTITGEFGDRLLPSSSTVVLTGNLRDVHSLIGRSAVSLAPLRIGGGTRLKILESFALRTPVVATSKGVEGLDVRNGEHLLIADNAPDFAASVLRLLRDPEYARAISDNAFKLVQTLYDWSSILPRFMNLVDRAADPLNAKHPSEFAGIARLS